MLIPNMSAVANQQPSQIMSGVKTSLFRSTSGLQQSKPSGKNSHADYVFLFLHRPAVQGFGLHNNVKTQYVNCRMIAKYVNSAEIQPLCCLFPWHYLTGTTPPYAALVNASRNTGSCGPRDVTAFTSAVSELQDARRRQRVRNFMG